uniref:DNA excision repair protein ERCC-6 n=1 Tax=Strigamia maritima TaxID=126957 RepID=T1IM14_STRMM
MDGKDVIEQFQDLGDGFKVPSSLWNKLYKFQQTCVQWLWELHCQQCGGIIGDEMGLGKTIQVIAFLAGLWFSKIITRGDKFRGLGPVLIVTPTTVMLQWVKEFHTWWPPFRVAILHESGSYTGTKESLIRNINNHGGILITSYGGVNLHQQILLRYDWHYVILDEGHKIRNPDAQITLACKQFPTPHRVILSGSPLQNNLKELWSLFDFTFPGKLGTLPVFMEQFSVPITLGGYANASTVQIRVAYKCAVVLRDTINAYILRRMKSDVKMNISLPNKNEQVLFCQLTDEQRNAYKEYLNSDELKSIMTSRLQVFVGLVHLRKICNHADLFTGGPKHFGDVDESTLSDEMRYGYWKRSGKLIVVEAILKIWHAQQHRVLLFTQSRQMLRILEDFIKSREYTYFKMDGTTSIGSRQPLITKFNSDPSIFIFLLTTRVGGLGVNLTGANRVIIFDPDWNPSTDLQAKERVWRIGQEKNVTIYRLLTTGTIEEKIYHRQIFKQFLTNRVLKDPRQRRFFKNNELYDLFTLQEQGSEGAESMALFAGTGSEIKEPAGKRKDRGKKSPKKIDNKTGNDVKLNSGLVSESAVNGESSNIVLSEEKCEQMRELAKKISQKLGKSFPGTNNGLNVDNNKKIKKIKKKKKVKTMFEGEQVSYLVKQEVYKQENEDREGESNKQDDYVLKKLFSKTGLQSALQHDVIMESPESDYKIVEAEADRVAKDCIKKVRRSRKFCFPAVEGVPNWTGSQETLPKIPKLRFGQKKNTHLVQNNLLLSTSTPASSKEKCETVTSGESNLSYNMKTKIFVAPQFTSTSVSSTQELLSKLKERDCLEKGDSESDEENAAIAIQPNTEYDELLVDMRNFIAFQSAVNGQAATQEILEHFKAKLPNEKSSVFKALLYQICDFSKENRMWYLKSDFR